LQAISAAPAERIPNRLQAGSYLADHLVSNNGFL